MNHNPTLPIVTETKIARLLDAYPATEAVLMGLSPQFAKLSNPVLRRTVARVATIAQAAQIAGLEPQYVIRMLRKAVGQADNDPMADSGMPSLGSTPTEKILHLPPDTETLDVRPILASGQSPLPEIIRRTRKLTSDNALLVIAPFRPDPVIDKLTQEGFDCSTRRIAEGEVHLLVREPNG